MAEELPADQNSPPLPNEGTSENTGVKTGDDRTVQPSGAGRDDVRALHLARWDTRFWAWLIDFILVILFLNIVRGALDSVWQLPLLWEYWRWEFFAVTFETLFFFAYWTVMEGLRGQSIGKMVMNLKVVTRAGKRISWPAAALQSFGKAFLLPLDCAIGWLAMPGTKLRVFNRISHTIVIRTDFKEPAGVIYVKEKE